MTEVKHYLGEKELQRTILTLNLSIAQIDLSMSEGDNSVMALIESFNYLSSKVDAINAHVEKLANLPENEVKQHLDEVKVDSQELKQQVTAAIIAFQFYDRLSQRLGHVNNALSMLADIVSNEMVVQDEEAWEALKERVHKDISMEEEKELFDLIFIQKMPAQSAIELMKKKMAERMNQAEEEDDIDLF